MSAVFFSARTYALQENYAQAAGIYKRLLQDDEYAEIVDEYEDVIESVREAERVYTAYGAQLYDDMSEDSQGEIKSAKSDLEDIVEEYVDAANFAFVRDALMKVRLMLMEYDEIAESIDNNATYTELIVVSRLYQKNAVKDKDFAEKYVAEYENNSKQIYKRLKDIFREVKGDLTTIEKQKSLKMEVSFAKCLSWKARIL